MFRLHGKATEELTFFFMLTQIFQDVIRLLQFQRQMVAAFFHFLIADRLGTVICYGSRLDDDILLCRTAGHFLKHLSGTLNGYYRHKTWFLDAGLTGHQSDFCSPEHTVSGYRITHFSGGMIGDVTHRIHCFHCGTCRHQNLESLHIFFKSDFF